MRPSTIFQICVLTCLYILSVVYGLKCFQCTSYENPECSSVKSNDTNSVLLKDCPPFINGSKTFCRKTYQKIEDDDETTRVKRSCGWIPYKEETDRCWRADSDFKKERNCQCYTDACNTSSKNKSIILKLFIAALVFLIYV